ncbi:MAG: DUF2530 domain-containing protein [Angustibacter sp.]
MGQDNASQDNAGESDAGQGDAGQGDDNLPTGHAASAEPIEPAQTNTARIVVAGTACWAVAFVVVIAVPTLHSDGREWWPWTCLSGVGLGLLGLAYVLRGRGNAAGARPSTS